jgi:hypothetical protein
MMYLSLSMKRAGKQAHLVEGICITLEELIHSSLEMRLNLCELLAPVTSSPTHRITSALRPIPHRASGVCVCVCVCVCVS